MSGASGRGGHLKLGGGGGILNSLRMVHWGGGGHLGVGALGGEGGGYVQGVCAGGGGGACMSSRCRVGIGICAGLEWV